MLSLALLAIFTSWSVGQQREVDAGVYAKLDAQVAGWRIWRFENKEGVTCKADRPTAGRSFAYPIGVGMVLHGGSPALELTAQNGEIRYWEIRAAHGRGDAEFRMVGDKFFKEWPSSGFPDAFAGASKIEVHVSSWEYPHSLVGHADEKGIVDLTTLSTAMDRLQKCSAG